MPAGPRTSTPVSAPVSAPHPVPALLRGQPRPRRPVLAARPPRWWQELLGGAIAYGLYGVVRNGAPARRDAALAWASDVLDIERTLHVAVERAVNQAVASVKWLALGVNYYYATLHFIVTIGVLGWLYRRHPRRYRGLRAVLCTTSLLALIGFWAFPLAPPRMLPAAGFVDTVVVFHTWGSWASGDIAAASNQLAAMPSLHFAWSLWCGLVLLRLASRRVVRLAGALYPLVTLAVIIGTANHFLLDAVGGGAVLLVGFGLQRLLFRRPAFGPSPPAYPSRGQPVSIGQLG
jgi:PAP2 superfamily